MFVNRIDWLSADKEKPSNERPVTVVLSKYKGVHTSGAYFKEGEWFDTRTDDKIEEEVICWADILIPSKYMV